MRVIKIKTEDELNKITIDNKVCDLHIYFNRPSDLQNLTFSNFFQQYNYSIKLPMHFQTTNTEATSQYYSILMLHTNKRYYIYKRNENSKIITRLEMVPLTRGEKWYIRLIFYNKPVLSFKEAKTVNGVTYPTFQQAALASCKSSGRRK